MGFKAVDNIYRMRDVHATVLHLMGLNDMRLTYYSAGRNQRLTDTGGKVIKEAWLALRTNPRDAISVPSGVLNSFLSPTSDCCPTRLRPARTIIRRRTRQGGWRSLTGESAEKLLKVARYGPRQVR